MFYAPIPSSPSTGLRCGPLFRRLQVKRVTAAFAGMTAAVSLIASIADLPVLSTELGYGLIMTALGFYFGVVLSDAVRVRVATSLVALVIAGGLWQLEVLQQDGDSRAQGAGDRGAGGEAPSKAKPAKPVKANLGGDPQASVRAFRRLWALDRDGRVVGLDRNAVVRVAFEVEGRAEDIIACAGGLLVSHGKGFLSRFGRRGRRRARYRYSRMASGQLACGGGSVWVTRPSEGAVVQLHARRLEYQDEFDLADVATSIAYGARALWMADADRSEVVGVDPISEEKLGPYPVLEDPRQILAARGSLWVLHRESACLMRFDVDRGEEVGSGVPLGRYPMRMTAHGGTISIVDYADRRLRQVDMDDRRVTTLRVPQVDRLTDVDAGGEQLSVVDDTSGIVLMFDRAARRALREANASRRSRGCPARAA